jgi:predicted RNase H-like nuclease
LTAASRLELKVFENQLDAVLCVWIAVCALYGRAALLGDQASAIWIPSLKIAFRVQRSFAVMLPLRATSKLPLKDWRGRL